MRTLLCLTSLAAVAAVFLGGCASGDQVPYPVLTTGLALRHVTVVNTRDGSLQPNRLVVVDGGRIVHVGANRPVRLEGAAKAIDARGQFLVPGYLDMHTHTLAAADAPTPPWPMLLAHGITGIREMSGSAALVERARRLNEDSQSGRIAAPEVVQVAGDLVAGMPRPEMAMPFVQRQKEMGANMVKVVAANREVTLAILAAAKVHDIQVAGHLSPALGAVEASAAGWRAVEHVGAGMGILLDCSADDAGVRRAIFNGEGAKPVPFSPAAVVQPMLGREADAPLYQRVLATQDEAKCRGVVRSMSSQGTWQVPTLIRLRTMLQGSDVAFVNDPNLIYVDKTRRGMWQLLGQRFAATVPTPATETFARYYAAQSKLVGLMAQEQVRLLTGSDLGGIWVIPGIGLHQEFRELAAAGLTPLQVLQATTLTGAEFLGRSASMGTVDEGKQADLVLLEANPLERVENLSRISGLVLKGRYFSGQQLQDMKRDVARAYGN